MPFSFYFLHIVQLNLVEVFELDAVELLVQIAIVDELLLLLVLFYDIFDLVFVQPAVFYLKCALETVLVAIAPNLRI